MRAMKKLKVLNQKGMTLIEIMIVLVIIAGLAGVLVTTVAGRLKAARIKEARILIQEVGKALELYNADCGSYPSSESGLQALVEDPGDCPNWGPDPYLKKIPKDPWQGDLTYEKDGGDYILMSYGSDGNEGGTGDAKDISSDDL